MADEWYQPINPSCLIIDGYAKIVVPEEYTITNNTEIIINSGILQFDNTASYVGKGVVRIGATGVLSIPSAEDVNIGECQTGAKLITDEGTYTYTEDEGFS